MEFPTADQLTRKMDDADYRLLGELLHEEMTDDAKLESAREGTGDDVCWNFIIHGEFRRTARDWVIEDLKKVGFHRVQIVCSSEQGERPGITGVRVFAHPEEK